MWWLYDNDNERGEMVLTTVGELPAIDTNGYSELDNAMSEAAAFADMCCCSTKLIWVDKGSEPPNSLGFHSTGYGGYSF